MNCIRKPALVVLALLTFVTAFGQSVRDDGRLGSTRTRDANRVAEKSSVVDWPDLEPGAISGTQVAFEGGYYDADLIVTTLNTYGEDKLIKLAKGIAAAAGYPNCDYAISRGRRLIAVDIMFDKFIQQHDGKGSFDYPIGAIAKFLNASDAQRPIGIFLDAGRHVDGQLGVKSVSEPQVFSIRSIKPQDMYRFEVKRYMS